MKTIGILIATLLITFPAFAQNVGIGITNPVFKLDVRNGSINVDSSYRIGTRIALAMPGSNTLCGEKTGEIISTGIANSFFGRYAGLVTTSGSHNSFFGHLSGDSNLDGALNSFFGKSSGASNINGNLNSFFGFASGIGNTSGNFNTAIGDSSLFTNTTGSKNTAIGYKVNVNSASLTNATAIGANARVDCNNCLVLGSVNGINEAVANVKVGIGITNPVFKLDVRNGSINTDSSYRIGTRIALAMPGSNTLCGEKTGEIISTGIANSFFGRYAGLVTTSGSHNSFFGHLSGDSNMDGALNSFFGKSSGASNINGNLNSFFGFSSGIGNTSGNFNTAIGDSALLSNVTGSRNTGLGYMTNVNSTAMTNATAIGANARVDCSNCMVLGSVNGINGGTSNINVGIGNNNPALPLSFGLALGDKISLYGNASSNYGFGVQGALLQIHADVMASDIAFGYGSSTSFTENMRIKGNGFVGIGTNSPGYILDVDGRMRIRSGGTNGTSAGLWLNNNANNTALAFFGMENDSYAGIYCAAGFQFKMNVTNGNVAVGSGDPTEKLTVHGNIKAIGNICYTGTNGACSDIRYKTKLSPLTNSLSKVLSLQGLYYFWRTDEFAEKEFSDERQIGFVAQEIEKLFPEIVQTDASGYKAVDYGRLTPVLVEAIKEQQDQIEQLKEENKQLIDQMTSFRKEMDDFRNALNSLKKEEVTLIKSQ